MHTIARRPANRFPRPTAAKFRPKPQAIRRTLTLAVGAFAYPVRRWRDLRLDGQRCDGCFDPSGRVIWLDAELEPVRWFETLRHEFEHAFEYHAGIAQGIEGRAQRAALVDGAFHAQIDAAGGINAIARIRIEGTKPTE